MEAALGKAQALRGDARAAVRRGVAGARVVYADVRGARDLPEAAGRLGAAARGLERAAGVQAFARGLVCLFFLNAVLEQYDAWSFGQQALAAHGRGGGGVEGGLGLGEPPGYPFFSVFVVLPAAGLCAVGRFVPLTASVLMASVLKDSALILLQQTAGFLTGGAVPDELTLKRLAMLGCTALVLTHGFQERSLKVPNFGGLLPGEAPRERGGASARSGPLIFGRVMVGLLLLYSGINQVTRVVARDLNVFRGAGDFSDGHDNNWLLIQSALVAPFLLGFHTEVVSRLLALCLVLEALTCWPFWSTPQGEDREHIRLHFFTNLSVSGGLVLLQSLGGGRFSVDAILKQQ